MSSKSLDDKSYIFDQESSMELARLIEQGLRDDQAYGWPLSMLRNRRQIGL